MTFPFKIKETLTLSTRQEKIFACCTHQDCCIWLQSGLESQKFKSLLVPVFIIPRIDELICFDAGEVQCLLIMFTVLGSVPWKVLN